MLLLRFTCELPELDVELLLLLRFTRAAEDFESLLFVLRFTLVVLSVEPPPLRRTWAEDSAGAATRAAATRAVATDLKINRFIIT